MSPKLHLALLIVLCALIGVWKFQGAVDDSGTVRVDGMHLGMPRLEAEAILESGEHPHTRITCDDEERVVSISGVTLEIEGVDLTPTWLPGEEPELDSEKLDTFLGEAKLVSPEKFAFVYSSRYRRYRLTVDIGCTGYNFVLGNDERVPNFVHPSEKRI